MSTEAEFNAEDIVEVGQGTVARLIRKAAESPRLRYRLCLHHSLDRLVHEMIIVANRSTYIRPHRHPPGKDESYYIIQGELAVFIFDAVGNVTRVLEMGEYSTGKTALYRLSASIWHLPVPRSEWVVYHEVFTGPFQKERDVEYAPWSPPETDTAAVAHYMTGLLALRAGLSGPP
jgi:cupin fold WbuC family metalloprotein